MLSADSRLLVKLWLRTPLRIATAAPSGAALAGALAAEAAAGDGWVVELGGGTGPVTRALIAAGVPSHRLLVLEQNPELHRVLAERFPAVTAVRGDAAQLRAILAAHHVTRVRAVVSTLPILTMPAPVQRAILDQSFAAMGDTGRFVQITYMPGSPVPRRRLRRWGYEAAVAFFAARNFPPATIWRYTRAAALADAA